MELQANLADLLDSETVMWAISNGDPAKLAEMKASEGLDFPFLLDPGAETIQRYGLLNEADERMIPHPAAILVDEAGVVRYFRVDENYRERPSIEELRQALAGSR